MLDAKKAQELEQAIALMVEFYPPAWWQLFNSSKQQGFTEAQAMELVKAFIMSVSAMAAGK